MPALGRGEPGAIAPWRGALQKQGGRPVLASSGPGRSVRAPPSGPMRTMPFRRLRLAAALLLATAAPAMAGTLDQIRARGPVACGVGESFPGFFAADSQGVYRGFDADLCRALAAAVLGDATRVQFRVATPVARFVQLQSGEVDVLTRSVTWTLTRHAAQALDFPAVRLFDGQGFLVRRAAGVSQAGQLAGAAICTQAGATTERATWPIGSPPTSCRFAPWRSRRRTRPSPPMKASAATPAPPTAPPWPPA